MNAKKASSQFQNIVYRPHGIHSVIANIWLMKWLYPLSIIFTNSLPNSSISFHTFICPICKGSGSRFTPDNYRPISLTSIACKTLESMIKDNMLQHMFSQSLITPFQHAWLLLKWSTVFAIIFIHYDWICSLSSFKNTHCMFFDLSKAFDSIFHRKLIHKLPKCI